MKNNGALNSDLFQGRPKICAESFTYFDYSRTPIWRVAVMWNWSQWFIDHSQYAIIVVISETEIMVCFVDPYAIQ